MLPLVIVLAIAVKADELRIAAAADLQFAMQEVAAQFQKETGTTVNVSYGSSGNFFQQIQNGAPFDVFFSANVDYAKQLEDSGLTVPGTLYEYAKGKIVIWVPNDSKFNLDSGFRALLDSSVKKISVANPQHAPYGKAAVSALQHENIYDQIKEKLVFGENISQTMTFVTSGAADVGIVALSLVVSPNMKDKGRYWEIPDDDYPAIDQACVALRSSKNQNAARQFVAFIKSPGVAEVLKKYGFVVPTRLAGK